MFSRLLRTPRALSAFRPPTRTIPTLHPRARLSPLAARHASTNVFSELRSSGLRRNRAAVTIFSLMLATAVGAAAYYLYLYNELVNKPLSVYPAPAAAEIKNALYYASRNDVGKMAAAFKAAITAAEESGMHPLSDEVSGLKIECAQLLLKLRGGELVDKAISVLEHVLDESAAGADYFEKEARWDDRNKVLKRAVLLGYKIGEIYQDIGKDGNAEEAMGWSTETLLKELRRRENGEVKNGQESMWFEDHEISACFEKLAQQYEKSSQYYLATPLYLKALTMISPNSCHAITLMNNLAAVLSRQKIPGGDPKDTKITRLHLLRDAQKWAEKALEIDAKITPPIRTEECDRACVAATHNLGEIARMLGKKAIATQRFEEALSLAKGIDLEEGVKAAKEGLGKTAKMKAKDAGNVTPA